MYLIVTVILFIVEEAPLLCSHFVLQAGSP